MPGRRSRSLANQARKLARSQARRKNPGYFTEEYSLEREYRRPSPPPRVISPLPPTPPRTPPRTVDRTLPVTPGKDLVFHPRTPPTGLRFIVAEPTSSPSPPRSPPPTPGKRTDPAGLTPSQVLEARIRAAAAKLRRHRTAPHLRPLERPPRIRPVEPPFSQKV